MADATFSCPDLTTFLGLDALGLLAVGQRLEARRAVIECRMPISVEDPFCKGLRRPGRGAGHRPAPSGSPAGGLASH